AFLVLARIAESASILYLIYLLDVLYLILLSSPDPTQIYVAAIPTALAAHPPASTPPASAIPTPSTFLRDRQTLARRAPASHAPPQSMLPSTPPPKLILPPR